LTEPPGVVVVIDDDLSVREALDSLIRSAGHEARIYCDVEEYLSAQPLEAPACLVLDVRLPGRSGLDLQRSLAEGADGPPIIFITAHGDVAMSVKAMKAGAIDFMTKPFGDQELLDAIEEGLALDRTRRARGEAMSSLRRRFATLSPREREVMALAVAGLLNKQIAAELGITEVTVKVHRGVAMRKMQAKTFAELVLAAEKLRGAGMPLTP
jgi:FixJ family two-component response regulator